MKRVPTQSTLKQADQTIVVQASASTHDWFLATLKQIKFPAQTISIDYSHHVSMKGDTVKSIKDAVIDDSISFVPISTSLATEAASTTATTLGFR